MILEQNNNGADALTHRVARHRITCLEPTSTESSSIIQKSETGVSFLSS